MIEYTQIEQLAENLAKLRYHFDKNPDSTNTIHEIVGIEYALEVLGYSVVIKSYLGEYHTVIVQISDKYYHGEFDEKFVYEFYL